MNLIERTEEAIERAELGLSNLTWPILRLSGMSSPKVRHFLNNIIYPDTRYLEVGCWRGSTFVAALWKNEPEIAFAIDNWSEFNDPNFQIFYFQQVAGHPRDIFLQNVERFVETDKKVIIEGDCFDLDPNSMGIYNINTYFYDGAHDYDSQHKSLTHYYEVLDKEFIFIVDDWNNDYAKNGTRDAIRDLNLTPLFEYEGIARSNGDVAEWWNGLYISVLRKE